MKENIKQLFPNPGNNGPCEAFLYSGKENTKKDFQSSSACGTSRIGGAGGANAGIVGPVILFSILAFVFLGLGISIHPVFLLGTLGSIVMLLLSVNSYKGNPTNL